MPITKELVTAKNDRMFKTIIATEDNHDLMNAIFSEVMDKEVTFVGYLKNDMPVRKKQERVKTLDVVVKSDGEYYNLELNTEKEKEALHVRNLNYFTSFYSQNTIRGEKYDTKTKFIHIDLSYNLSQNIPLRSSYKLRTENAKWEYVNNFEIIEINMDKLQKLWYDGNKEIEDKYRHLLMLNITNIDDLERLGKGDELVKAYKEKLVELNQDEEFIRSITPEEDAMLIENTIRDIIYDKGLTEGQEKGLAIGEKNKQIEMTKNLLAENMSLDFIERTTGLTKREIEEIKNN